MTPDKMPLDSELEQELLRSELEMLYQVSQVLSRSLDLKETLMAVLRVLHEGVGLERGMVSLVEPETGELQVSVAHGLADIFIEEIRYRPGEGVVGLILEEGEPITVECIADEPALSRQAGLVRSGSRFCRRPDSHRSPGGRRAGGADGRRR